MIPGPRPSRTGAPRAARQSHLRARLRYCRRIGSCRRCTSLLRAPLWLGAGLRRRFFPRLTFLLAWLFAILFRRHIDLERQTPEAGRVLTDIDNGAADGA